MHRVRFVREWPVEGGPDGIAVNQEGEVFVNINSRHCIARYSPEGMLLAEWSFEGRSQGIAVSPSGEVFVNINQNYRVVRHGSAGEVFVNINQNHRIFKYSGEGDLLAQWGGEGEANGLAVNRDGDLFVNINQNYRTMGRDANGEISVNINQNYRVVKYDPAGHLLEEWTLPAAGSGIATSPEGRVLGIHNLLQVTHYSPAGNPIAEWPVGAGVIESNGIVVGPRGEVFVNINQNHRVAKYGPRGGLLAEWGGEGDQPGEFRSPAGVALGPDGLVYVADKGNSRIQVFWCP